MVGWGREKGQLAGGATAMLHPSTPEAPTVHRMLRTKHRGPSGPNTGGQKWMAHHPCPTPPPHPPGLHWKTNLPHSMRAMVHQPVAMDTSASTPCGRWH